MSQLTPYQEGQCIEVSVEGIPALAYITHYDPGCPGCSGGMGPPLPPDPPELEYELYDRHGYKADWLERLADQDRDAVERQIWRTT